MSNFLKKPIISTKDTWYVNIVVFLVPLFNLLPGLTIDMYAPSLPAITQYFGTSPSLAKNTMTAVMLGIVLGSILFGFLIDTLGRKRSLITGILVYAIVSLLGVKTQSIYQLMIVRFIQGLMVASISIGCRAVIIDSITGHRYAIAILYASIAFGSARTIGPYFGGLLQHAFGWTSNFYCFSAIALAFLFFLIFFLKESIPKYHPFKFSSIISQYKEILLNRFFILGILISAIIQIELLFYPTIGPFVVENVLGFNVLCYANTALLIGIGYLFGTIVNRYLISYFSPSKVCTLGFLMLIIGLIFSLIFSAFFTFNLVTLVLPIWIVCAATGMIYPIIMGENLKLFPNAAGMAVSLQISLVAMGAAVGLFILSHLSVQNLSNIFFVYLTLIFLQTLMYFTYKKIFVRTLKTRGDL